MTCPRCHGLLRPADEYGVRSCWQCSHTLGVPAPPPAVPDVTPFRDVPDAPMKLEAHVLRRAILRELVTYPNDTQAVIAERLGVSWNLVGVVAVRHGLNKTVGGPRTVVQATYRDQLRRIVVGGKAPGKTRVA